MMMAVAKSAVGVRAVGAAAVIQATCSGVSVSMSLARALKPGLGLTASRRCLISSLRSPVVVANASGVPSRSYSRNFKPVAGQWKPEDTEGFGRGFEGLEVEVDSNEFPKPSSVVWTKDLANTVHLIGNVGRDMEIKYLDTGKVVAKSSLAVSKPSKKDEAPSWFEMEFWDSLAEIAGHHLKKGDWVYVTGRVVVDTFMKNEVNQRTARVVVQNVNFVEDSRSATTPGFSQGAAQGPGRNTSSSWAQPTQSTQSTQSRGTQSSGSKPRAPGNPDVERLWNEYFSDPRQWWDNRAKKASPKSPDFKHKTTNEALWVVSRNTPTWVPLQLEKLEAARQEFIASGGGNRGQNNRSFSGAEFKDF